MSNNSLIGGIGTSGQGVDLVPINPSDTEDLPVTARALRCRPDGAAGTLRFTAWNGMVSNTYIAAGETLLVIARRVHASGTTATKLEAYL